MSNAPTTQTNELLKLNSQSFPNVNAGCFVTFSSGKQLKGQENTGSQRKHTEIYLNHKKLIALMSMSRVDVVRYYILCVTRNDAMINLRRPPDCPPETVDLQATGVGLTRTKIHEAQV